MNGPVVVGIDIKSGSPRSKQRPLYSVSIISNDGVLFEREVATFDEIIALMNRYGATILATDNVYELARDSKGLREVISKLPSGSKLVQVTGSPNNFRPLSSIAKEMGLSAPSRRDPLESARLIAQLALRGVGFEVVAMYPETRILITRNRSVKQGGSGSDRWRRSIEASILSEANRIATELDLANLDYDLYVERASGGLRRAEFIVYASMSEVRKVVKESSEWAPLRIFLRESWRRKIKFPSGDVVKLPKSRPIIVGIDPGMSVGLAILDLKGNLLLLKTLRRASRSEIIEEILDHGYPVIIATDVNPPPKSVIRIANTFDSKLVVAKYDMKAEEKKRIVSEYEERTGIRVESSHERDSLAAALKVYLKVKNLITKIRQRINELDLPLDPDEIARKVLKGMSISLAIEEALSEEVKKDRDLGLKHKYSEVRRELRRANRYIRSLMSKIAELKRDIERYEALLREKEEEIAELKKRIELLEDRRNMEIEVDRRISARDARIRELEKQLARERWKIDLLRSQINQLTSQDKPPEGIRLTVLPSLSKDRIEMLQSRVSNVGEVIVALDASGASSGILRKLKDLGIRAVLYRGSPPPKQFIESARNMNIVVGSVDEYKIVWNGITPVIPNEEAFRLLAKLNEDLLKEKMEVETDLLNIIRSYRLSLAKSRVDQEALDEE